MNQTFRNTRLAEYIKEAVSEFLTKTANSNPMITVTRVSLADSLKKALILISVYPEDQEQKALEFLKRKRSDARVYLKKNIKTRSIPIIDFEIDKGEKNRQKIEDLSK